MKWTAPENLHLTLLFLGDTKAELIPDLANITHELARAWEAVSLVPKGIGLFPAQEPRMLWLSLDAAQSHILELHRHLSKEVRALGIAPDAKNLRLHVTLGRIKQQIPPHLERQILSTSIPAGSMVFDTLTLYRSILRPEGPKYIIIEQSILH